MALREYQEENTRSMKKNKSRRELHVVIMHNMKSNIPEQVYYDVDHDAGVLLSPLDRTKH